MSWHDGIYAGWDTETTGIDTTQDRIVTAGVGWTYPAQGKGWTAQDWLLRQDQPIPEAATAVHGITTEHANERGADHTAGIRSIRDVLYAHWMAGALVVGYNVCFDFTILHHELLRIGEPGLEIRGPVFDPLVVDKAMDRYRKGSRKLIDTCRHYGVTLTDAEAHGAGADALAATRLAWKMTGQLPVPPEKLMEWQAAEYEQQRVSLAAYFRRQGKLAEAEDVESRLGWPVDTTHQLA